MAMTKISAANINWDTEVTFSSSTVSIDLISYFKSLSPEETQEVISVVLDKLNLSSNDFKKMLFCKNNLL